MLPPTVADVITQRGLGFLNVAGDRFLRFAWPMLVQSSILIVCLPMARPRQPGPVLQCGTYYVSGVLEWPCSIQLVGQQVRATDHFGGHSLVTFEQDHIVARDWPGTGGRQGLAAQIRGDTLLWMNGMWWCRQPSARLQR